MTDPRVPISNGLSFAVMVHHQNHFDICLNAQPNTTFPGTWLDSSSDLDHGKIEPPSNVTRITRSIRSLSADGIPQIIYYQAGVGSVGNIANKLIGGLVGAGIAENVREAYTFIANNYERGDEIFLLGFSRGAFTSRSVGGLIGHIGVMTKKGLPSFPVVYRVSTSDSPRLQMPRSRRN